jgi:hypothetical protein
MQALRDVAPALLKEEPDEVVWRCYCQHVASIGFD